MYLNCHSYHSLRYGTIPLEALVQQAAAFNVKAAALTDINTVTGIYDFIKQCCALQIKPLVGMEFRQEHKLLYIGLAKNRNGLAELCRLLTRCNIENIPLPESAPELNDAVVIYPLENTPAILKEHEFIGIRPAQLVKLMRPEWKERINKMVILQPVTFRTKKEYNLHKILRAIEKNVVLSKLKETDFCDEQEKMTGIGELLACYKEYPQIIKNTEAVIDDCNFEFDFKAPKNKKHYTNSSQNDMLLLENLAHEGLKKRYGNANKEAAARVRKELEVIDKLGFSAYFLITWDIIRYSNSCGMLHIGRGSGANSIVSYCLGITEICPIELNLYFERFLNPGRSSPPDFDIDWSWKDRDRILNYIFKRFGHGHTAFTGTNVEFKFRSQIRELGKVFGLPKEELDQLIKPSGMQAASAVVQKVHEYAAMLDNYPNARSMHSCGILISEEPITNYTALEMPPKGFPIVQFDMHTAEAIGFEKFDILSQRGIGHINDCVEIIEKNRGERVNIRDIALSKNDALCNQALQKGNTLGCFYIESPAMRGLLRRLKCDNYKVLVAASSVIRPGVAQSGMMQEYIFRHNNPGRFEYFHPVFEEQLGETYGIMVYQEDVIKIAHHFAGLDLADADILRRAMSGKTRSQKEFEGVRSRFFEKCREKGYSDQLSEEVYRQIKSFAGYSFCKAHSASYAVESYQSLYLKVHYPVEFMAAVINNFGGFYRTEIYVHEAKMSGAVICAPCVNKSEHLTAVYGKDVYLGFIHLQGLEEKIAKHIADERNKNGNYRSLEDFILRVPAGIEALQILIYIGAFRFTGKQKSELILIGRMLLVNFKPEKKNLLFEEPVKEYKLPVLSRSLFEDAFDEMELLGFSISCSPFDLLKTKYRGNALAKDLLRLHKKTVRMTAYLISKKEVPTKRGTMYFGTWIDAAGEYFDTAHFPDSLADFPFLGGGCYLLQGRVEIDFHFPVITIQKMGKLPFIDDPRYGADEDKRFHINRQMKEDTSATYRAPYPSEKDIGLPRHKMK